jgi:uncharacterized protein YktA (UPF0223 family)
LKPLSIFHTHTKLAPQFVGFFNHIETFIEPKYMSYDMIEKYKKMSGFDNKNVSALIVV